MQTRYKIAALLCAQFTLLPLTYAEQTSSSRQVVRNWQLIDLDEDDGVTPSVQFLNATLEYRISLTQELGQGQKEQQEASGALDPTRSWQQSFTYQNRGVTLEYRSGDAATLMASGFLFDKGAYYARFDLKQNFILSPNTLLVFYGEKSASAFSEYQRDRYRYAGASQGIALEASERDHAQGFDNSSYIDTYWTGNRTVNQADNFGFYNLTGHAMNVSYERRIKVDGENTEPWIPPSVPEAETWAMLIGGLALCGIMARRRKQAGA